VSEGDLLEEGRDALRPLDDERKRAIHLPPRCGFRVWEGGLRAIHLPRPAGPAHAVSAAAGPRCALIRSGSWAGGRRDKPGGPRARNGARMEKAMAWGGGLASRLMMATVDLEEL
jgi:hypothetical protein